MIRTLLANQILFKPFPPDKITEGGLIVPDSCKSVNNKGIVILAGRGTKEKPTRLKAGMIVHRTKDWGEPMVIDGETYYLMDEAAILAIHEE